MSRKEKKIREEGFGRILDAWVPSEGAGDPIGCVATSFTFSPVFFEEECLGRFLHLESDPNEDGPAYLIEREEKLAPIMCAAVLVDQHHCRGSRNLRWDLLPARLKGSVLHAKLSLLHWTNLIRLIVSSSNLTDDGYRRNQEIFGVVDYKPGGSSPLDCLKQTISFLRLVVEYSQIDSGSPPLQRWYRFLDRAEDVSKEWGVVNDVWDRKAIGIQSVISGPGYPDIFKKLDKIWPSGSPPVDAFVASPFYDDPDSPNKPAERLWGILKQRGRASVSYYVSAEDSRDEEGTVVIHAPQSLKLSQPQGRDSVKTNFYRVDDFLKQDKIPRPYHLKSLWLENDRFVVYIMGSSNFTSPGMGISKHPNIEVNLAYLLDRNRDSKRKKARFLEASFMKGEKIPSDISIKWELSSAQDDNPPENTEELPLAFSLALYDSDDEGKGIVILHFAESPPPEGWRLMLEDKSSIFYGEKEWKKNACPSEIRLEWHDGPPPSGFWVSWTGSKSTAWWPVNVVSAHSLPPPAELKDLPLEVLINILTSARPLHKVFKEYLARKNERRDGPNEDLDPHKRVDTSQFLLRRTRRISWALNSLRERLERPVATMECLKWRLYGPVGVMALAKALERETHSDEERAFLLTELALELTWVKPNKAPGCLSPDKIRQEIRSLLKKLKNTIPRKGLKNSLIDKYVQDVFNLILR